MWCKSIIKFIFLCHRWWLTCQVEGHQTFVSRQDKFIIPRYDTRVQQGVLLHFCLEVERDRSQQVHDSPSWSPIVRGEKSSVSTWVGVSSYRKINWLNWMFCIMYVYSLYRFSRYVAGTSCAFSSCSVFPLLWGSFLSEAVREISIRMKRFCCLTLAVRGSRHRSSCLTFLVRLFGFGGVWIIIFCQHSLWG